MPDDAVSQLPTSITLRGQSVPVTWLPYQEFMDEFGHPMQPFVPIPDLSTLSPDMAVDLMFSIYTYDLRTNEVAIITEADIAKSGLDYRNVFQDIAYAAIGEVLQAQGIDPTLFDTPDVQDYLLHQADIFATSGATTDLTKVSQDITRISQDPLYAAQLRRVGQMGAVSAAEMPPTAEPTPSPPPAAFGRQGRIYYLDELEGVTLTSEDIVISPSAKEAREAGAYSYILEKYYRKDIAKRKEQEYEQLRQAGYSVAEDIPQDARWFASSYSRTESGGKVPFGGVGTDIEAYRPELARPKEPDEWTDLVQRAEKQRMTRI